MSGKPKTALLRRMQLFLRNRHVDWHDTAMPLDDTQLRQLESDGRRRRTQSLNALDTDRQLKALRRKLARHAEVSSAPELPDAADAAPDSLLPDAPAALQTAATPQAFMVTQPPAPAIGAQVVISAVPQVLEAMRFLPTQASAQPHPQDGPAAQSAPSKPGEQAATTLEDPVAAAALCLASGDIAGARTQLQAAMDEGGDLGELARAWLELLWVLDEKAEFDRAVSTIGRHCGAPWTQWRERAVRSEELCAFHATERLSSGEAHLLARVAAQADDPWHDGEALFDFMRIRVIDDDAFTTLGVAIKRLQSLQGPFVLQGATCLLAAIHQRLVQPGAEAPAALWHCQLEMLRLLGHQREFMECARQYHEHKGAPLLPWFACEARFSSYVVRSADNEIPALGMDDEPGSVRLSLKGEITLETIDTTVALLEARAREAQRVDVDCRHLIRVDFESAVSLLNWAHRCRQRGATLRLLNLGVLNGALFRQVGLTDYASLHAGPALTEA